jgi:hypothetical protein
MMEVTQSPGQGCTRGMGWCWYYEQDCGPPRAAVIWFSHDERQDVNCGGYAERVPLFYIILDVASDW